MRGRKGAREGVMNGGRDRWREGGRDAGREGGSRRDGICLSLAGWFGFIEVTPVHSHGVAIRSQCCRICDVTRHVSRWKRLDPETFGMRRVKGKGSISSIL